MFTQYKVSLDNVIDLVDMLSLSSPPRSPEELEASWFSSRWAHLSFFTCSLRAAREKNWKRKGISSSFCATFANVQLAKASHMSSPHQFGRVTHKGMWFGGCYYNNLPHTWNSTHNLKNSKEATFHYRLKLCLISEPGHWPGHWSPGLFIKASNYLMNSKIILHLGVYFGWIYSFIKCKLLMLTLTLYQKKKKKRRVGGNSFQLRAQAWFVSRGSRSLYGMISSRDSRGVHSLGEREKIVTGGEAGLGPGTLCCRAAMLIPGHTFSWETKYKEAKLWA